MQLRVTQGVEDGEQDQARRAEQREHDGQAGQHLLTGGGVGHEAAAVPQPAIGAEGHVQQDGGDDAAGDEERLELGGADVADVRDLLAVIHGGITLPMRVDDPVQQQTQKGAEPDEAGEDGSDLLILTGVSRFGC